MGALTELIPETLTVDIDGKSTPLRDTPFVKESADIGAFAKRAWDNHSEVGRRIPLNVDKSKPETVENWRKENLPKLYAAGIMEAPPAKPEDYGITKPEGLYEGLTWSDERAGKFAGVLHKYGMPKGAAAELLEIHREGLLGSQAALKTSYDEGIAALKREYGDKYDERIELVKRFTGLVFKTPEELMFFNETGIGNHPVFLSVMMRLAPFATQDTSLNLGDSQRGGGEMTAESVRAEVADIMSNKNNPRHAGYLRNDPEVSKYIDELYKKVHGEGKVTI